MRSSLCLCLCALAAALAAPAAWGEEPFPRPPELEPAVEFWKRVYTEVDTDAGLLHDRRYLNVVYEVVEFPPDSSPAERERIERARKRHYRSILARLASGDRGNLDAEAREVLKLWGQDVSDATLRRARHRLRLQPGQADRFRAGVARSGRWLPKIRETLEDAGVPQGLAALPHVESSFNPESRSHAGAAGLWQFTRTTGRRYLRIDDVVDERLDPLRATEAAARLLEHNRHVTGSWALAVNGYNHGAAGMRRAVRRVGTRDIATIIRENRSPTFGFASRNFYPAFLAALEISRNPEVYFPDIDYAEPLEAMSVEAPAFLPISAIEKVYDVHRTTLRELNRGLRASVWDGRKLVPRGYKLRLPEASGPRDRDALLAALDAGDLAYEQRRDRHHTVQRGQTLSAIAARYDVSTGTLMSVNDLASPHRIRPGQRLRVPGVAPTASGGVRDGVYTVQPGDTLSEISDRFRVSMEQLAEENDLANSHRIYAGQKLRIAHFGERDRRLAASEDPEPDTAGETGEDGPASEGAGDSEPGRPFGEHDELSADPSDYVVAPDGTIEVQAAETLGHYAEWLNTRASELRRLNGLSYGEPVIIGERLQLDFTKVSPERFEQRREAHHRLVQQAFFERHRIVGTETYTVQTGDSLWSLSGIRDNVPLWLLRQHNPDLDADSLKPGMEITIPRVEVRDTGEADLQQALLKKQHCPDVPTFPTLTRTDSGSPASGDPRRGIVARDEALDWLRLNDRSEEGLAGSMAGRC